MRVNENVDSGGSREEVGGVERMCVCPWRRIFAPLPGVARQPGRAALNVCVKPVEKRALPRACPLPHRASEAFCHFNLATLSAVRSGTGTEACSHITMASSSHSPLPAHTPPTPSQDGTYSRMSFAGGSRAVCYCRCRVPASGTPPMPLPMSASMSRPSAGSRCCTRPPTTRCTTRRRPSSAASRSACRRRRGWSVWRRAGA